MQFASVYVMNHVTDAEGAASQVPFKLKIIMQSDRDFTEVILLHL